MTFLTIVIIAFLLLEISNVFVLFFTPDSRQVHGMGMFPVWERSKKDPNVYNLMRYLGLWVAGSKLILIVLLIVILVLGNPLMKVVTGYATALSMLPFYGGLFPAMKKIDENDQVEPKGFAMRLGFTITMLILALLIGSTLAFFEIR